MNLKPKILIVDDRPENLIALEVVLKDLDIELVKASSGNEALKATLYHDFALALLDIQMPEMDGYELATILREEEKTSRLPFIFISAVYTDNLNVFRGYEKGAFSFITKPFQPEILINKVRFFIDKHIQEISLFNINIDLQKKNSELEYMNKELDAFSYSVSHDLKSPLRAIEGYTKILREDYEQSLDQEGNRLMQAIIDNTTRMNDLIDSLLVFSRLGKREISKTIVDMNALLTRVVSEFSEHNQLEKPRIEIQDLLPAMGDVSLLQQVFVNLVSNAIKYSGKAENPRVEISSYAKDQSVVYCVKDNGVGFNMQYKHRLFGVFQRLHDGNEFEGIGIGLAIVQRIVSRHGGTVWAEGEKNKGAAFFISLPTGE